MTISLNPLRSTRKSARAAVGSPVQDIPRLLQGPLEGVLFKADVGRHSGLDGTAEPRLLALTLWPGPAGALL